MFLVTIFLGLRVWGWENMWDCLGYALVGLAFREWWESLSRSFLVAGWLHYELMPFRFPCLKMGNFIE